MDLQELQSAYLLTFQQKINALQKTIEAQDLKHLLHLIHQLSGSSGSYGFMDLFALTDGLEQMINSSANFSPEIQQQTLTVIDCMQRLQKQ